MPDIRDNLVSFADFTDVGSTILPNADGGGILNFCYDKQIVLTKDFCILRLRLADIVDCNHKRKSHPAYAASTVFLLPTWNLYCPP